MTLERDDDGRRAEREAIEADLREDESLSDAEAAQAAEIRADIEETQGEMSGTLSELGDRLEPGRLINEAKENVREATIGRVEETAKGVSDMVLDTIKRNPIPAAMAGAGLALLWANRSNGSSHDRRWTGDGRSYGASPTGADWRYGAYGIEGGRSGEQGIGDRASDVASGARDAVGDAAGQVGETVGQVGQNVGQAAGQVGTQLDRVMRANPLAVGAIAIGAGAVIGALVPETQGERQVLGDASRQIGSTVREAVDSAAAQADEALDEADRKVGSTT